MSNPPTIDDFIPPETLDEALADISVDTAAPKAPEGATEPLEAEAAQTEPDATEDATEAQEDDSEAEKARMARELREERRRRRNAETDAQIARGQRQVAPDEALEREIEARVQERLKGQTVVDKSKVVLEDGVKQFGPAFNQALADLGSELGQGFAVMADAIVEVAGAEKLIMHLADNPDLAANIASMSPARMGVALATEAAKITAPKPIPKSKAPKPIKPIVTGNVDGNRTPRNDEEWVDQMQDDFIKSLGYGR